MGCHNSKSLDPVQNNKEPTDQHNNNKLANSIQDGPTEEQHDSNDSTKPSSEDKDVLEIFKKFDANGDQVVSIEEFQNGMEMLGRKVTLEETKNLFKLVNPDGDGETVNYARVFRNKIFKLDCCH